MKEVDFGIFQNLFCQVKEYSSFKYGFAVSLQTSNNL